MATRTETRQIRLAQWHKIFQQKAESGLTAKNSVQSITFPKMLTTTGKTLSDRKR